MSIAIKSFGVCLKKEPLPLKKPLELLDESDLSPYKVVSKEKIESEDVIESLGTENYIQWELEDTNTSSGTAVRYCELFITYYDLPDYVPHVPEECYIGTGFQLLASDSVTFEINRASARHKNSGPDQSPFQTQKIPGKYLVFTSTSLGHWQSSPKIPVLYLFNVNGVYTDSREEARMTLNKNIFGKYSYFSKVEWKFFNEKYGARIYPTRTEAIMASEKLLAVILPVLESQHWPDWPAQ